MGLSLPANTTCDIYRSGHAPPAAPDVAAVRCHLQADYARRMETGESEQPALRFTHALLLDVAADVRDDFDSWGGLVANDTVYVPDKNGTAFRVVFVERHARGLPADCKKVYLDRHTPNWPTNNL
jgi:hypothetical protein